MARALANECSTDDKKVAFFMRKGADCLSKWVGESERQLRLLFVQAYQMRPSIIFFDEIDGLAPVRSSRQDQIHSSIVSTLLALMDGLDSRGEIVVIGATNRIDSIDPALRRPGRFDREFLFPLPDKKSRHDILKIHTSKWDPPLSSNFIETIAEKTVGYCGADLKALCTEATLNALRKSFPQIYATNDKLKFDVDKIKIGPNNFYRAMKVRKCPIFPYPTI
uniref:AAA+ ATPase domain-containing protein n=1 Tax=Ciona intestinalis TaxID=7719 RepID=H2XQQ2_CIOIN